jgi:N-methylhydantoinase B/oxoprolinase/acetone carboxylase alpha subunit
MLITNDPWRTSGHLNDVTVCNPVFRGQDCIAFFASTCHSADIGGHVLSAEAREVYEEGLFIPIMKLYDRGRLNESLAAIIRANTRVPDLVMGDFHAQVAGGTVGGERLREFMDEFGLERLGASGRRDHHPHRAGMPGDRRAAARRIPILALTSGRLRRADHHRGALRDSRR